MITWKVACYITNNKCTKNKEYIYENNLQFSLLKASFVIGDIKT